MSKTEIKISLEDQMRSVPDYIKWLYAVRCRREEEVWLFPPNQVDGDFFKVYRLASTAQRELYRACKKIGLYEIAKAILDTKLH